MQADGSVVGDIHAGMEGQLIQQCAGAEPVAIKQANQRDDARRQTRHDQYRFRQLIREVLLVLAAVGVDDLFHAVAHVVDGVSQVVLHLHRRLAHFGVLRVLEHREGHGAHVPREELLIEDEAVDFRVLGHSADERSGNNLHERDFFALRRLRRNVARQQLIVHAVLQENLRVAAHGHQVRRNADDGVNGRHAPSVGSKSEHGTFLSLLSSAVHRNE